MFPGALSLFPPVSTSSKRLLLAVDRDEHKDPHMVNRQRIREYGVLRPE